MNNWTPSYRTYNPADPAQFKGSYTGQNGVDPAYANAVGDYNSWLYTAQDRRRQMPLSPITQTHYDASRTGWQGAGNAGAGTTRTPYGNITTSTGSQYAMLHGMMAPYNPSAPYNLPGSGPFSQTQFGGSQVGQSGSASPQLNRDLSNASAKLNLQNLTAPAIARNGIAGAQDQVRSGAQAGAGSTSTDYVPPMAQYPGAPTPPQNSLQRWQSFAQGQPQSGGDIGLRPISDAKRYFWATGRIDGRAPLAQTQNGLDTGPQQGYRSVQFNNSPSGWNSSQSPYSPFGL